MLTALDEAAAGNEQAELELRKIRGLLLWSLYHHQGGSSTIGQPIRKILGIEEYAVMTHEQIEEAQIAGGVIVTPNAVLGAWLPIETAPKDKRILLGYELIIFNGINSVCGCWDDDRYAKKPKPFWTHDMYRLKGARETRAQQPIAWMPLPEAPNAELTWRGPKDLK